MVGQPVEMLIPERLRAVYIKPFQKAVDLGAAPGGWTWQLVHRGMQAIAPFAFGVVIERHGPHDVRYFLGVAWSGAWRTWRGVGGLARG